MELKDILSTDDKLRIIQELVPGNKLPLHTLSQVLTLFYIRSLDLIPKLTSEEVQSEYLQ